MFIIKIKVAIFVD